MDSLVTYYYLYLSLLHVLLLCVVHVLCLAKYSPMPSFIQCRKPYTNGLIIPVYIVLGYVDITNQIMIGYSESINKLTNSF